MQWKRLNNKSCLCLCLWRFSPWSCLKEFEVNGSPHQRERKLYPFIFGQKVPLCFVEVGDRGDSFALWSLGLWKAKGDLSIPQHINFNHIHFNNRGTDFGIQKRERTQRKKERQIEREGCMGEVKALHSDEVGPCQIINWCVSTNQIWLLKPAWGGHSCWTVGLQ